MPTMKHLHTYERSEQINVSIAAFILNVLTTPAKKCSKERKLSANVGINLLFQSGSLLDTLEKL